MDHNKENLWTRGSKKRKNSDSRNAASKRRSHFAFPVFTHTSGITGNRLTSRLGIFNHAIITDASQSRNRKGAKEKLNSICSNYFQRNEAPLSPDEGETEEPMTQWPSLHYLDVDEIATEIANAVKSLELTNYINPVRARLQKMFYESCQAHEKLRRDKRYSTPFSEQLTPVVESSQPQCSNNYEDDGYSRTNRVSEYHEMKKQPLNEDPAEEMLFGLASADYNPFPTMETFGDANHFIQKASDPSTSHIPHDLAFNDQKTSTHDSHCIVNRSIYFLNFLDREDDILNEARSESHSVCTATDVKAERSNEFWSSLFEEDVQPEPRKEEFDASSIFLESLKHEKRLLSDGKVDRSSLWELESRIDVDKLFRSPDPKFLCCQDRHLVD